MPYLTPEGIPEEDVCRPLFIPASTEWLALFSGALTELTKPYNWEQFGALTVDETVEKMQSIINAYYASACADCVTPGGYRVVRLNENGQVEQLNSSGEWEAGTGDYYIPPPAARTGGTEEDQICLAATNAVNVLAQLYESLSDSWNNSLDNHEALTALIAVSVAGIGFALAPITWAIGAFVLGTFALVYTALEFIGADLWTDAVSDQIKCFLIDCATNNAGVVTFDYGCFTEKLNSLANDFSLTEGQLRLYIQIGYLFYFIGGIDGLNLAGRTTEITTADCSDCPGDFCDYSDFSTGELGFSIRTIGVYQTDFGWRGQYGDSESATLINISRTFDPRVITSAQFNYARENGSGSNFSVEIELFLDAVQVGYYSAPGSQGNWYAMDHNFGTGDIAVYADEIRMTINNGSGGGNNAIGNATITGEGTDPFDGVECV